MRLVLYVTVYESHDFIKMDVPIIWPDTPHDMREYNTITQESEWHACKIKVKFRHCVV